MRTKYKGSRSRLRGAKQLELFPPDALAACARPPRGPSTDHGRVMLQEVRDDDSTREDVADDGPGFQLVAVWHDHSWQPLRFFRRGDGATVVVFRVA